MLESFTGFSPLAGDIVGRFFERDWIDAAVRPGKMLGAFCATMVPERHPYVLMNYAGERRSVLTLAHELGHGLHGSLAQDLGLLNARAPLTLAETASVFGEALTFETLREREEDPRAVLDLLIGRIDDAVATVFRQIALNRFEHAIHTGRREEGELRSNGSPSSGARSGAGCWATLSRSLTATGSGRATCPTSSRRRVTSTRTHSAISSRSRSTTAISTRARRSSSRLDLLRPAGRRPRRSWRARLGFDIGDPDFWSAGLDAIGVLVDEAEQLAAQLDA